MPIIFVKCFFQFGEGLILIHNSNIDNCDPVRRNILRFGDLSELTDDFFRLAPSVMLIFAVLLFFGYIISNPYPSLYALALLAISYPIFCLVKII